MGGEVEAHSSFYDLRGLAETVAEERDEEVRRELVPEFGGVVPALPESLCARREPLVDLVGFAMELTLVVDDVAVPAFSGVSLRGREEGGTHEMTGRS